MYISRYIFKVRTPAPPQSEPENELDLRLTEETKDATYESVDPLADPPENLRYIGEVTLNHFSTLENARKTLEFIFGVIREKNSKIKALHKSKRDLEKKVFTIRHVLEDMRNNELISDQAMRLIKACIM